MASDKIVLVLDLGTDAMQAIEACVGDITVSDVRRASYSWAKTLRTLNAHLAGVATPTVVRQVNNVSI